MKKQRPGRTSSGQGRRKNALAAPERPAPRPPAKNPLGSPEAWPDPAGDPTILLFKELFKNGPEPGVPRGPAKPPAGVGRRLDAGDGYGG